MDPQPATSLAAFVELARIRVDEVSPDEVVSRVADLAKRTVPGADEVSVTLVRDDRAHTAASTADLATRLDEEQYERGHGPCLQAAADNTTVSVVDTARESRWPGWAAAAVSAGVRSSLSVGLPVPQLTRGALNVYSTATRAFDGDAILLTNTFADCAGAAVSNSQLYATSEATVQQLHDAMQTRAVIEQAKGIIVAQRRCTAEVAFAVLAKASQDSNRKLRDVAAALVARMAGGSVPE